MKNKNLLVALSKLLKVEESVITASAEKEDGDDSLVKSYTDKHQAYTLEELSTLLKNSNKQYLEKADFDINEVPKGLYSKIAAASIESKEKSLAKEHGVEEYKDFKDLFNKVVESKTGKGVDELTKQQIQTLKATIQTLEQEKESAVNKVKSEYDNDFMSRDYKSALLELPKLKGEKEVVENKIKLLSSAFNSEFKLGRQKNTTVVLDSYGKIVVDKLGEPEKISNVLKSFADGYGFEFEKLDTGGRGASSSENKPSLKGLTFEQTLASKGIQPHTSEADEVFKEWKAANQN